MWIICIHMHYKFECILPHWGISVVKVICTLVVMLVFCNFEGYDYGGWGYNQDQGELTADWL